MPISAECPECHRSFDVDDDKAGQAVTCACGALVRAPGSRMVPSAHGFGPAPVPTPEMPGDRWYEDRVLDDRWRDEHDLRPDPRWRTTRAGISLTYFSTWAMVVLTVLMIVGAIAAGVAGGALGHPMSGMGPALLLMGLVALGSLVAFIMMFVGQCMACTVPQDSGAKGLIIGAVVCQGGGFVLYFAGGVIGGAAIALSAIGGLAMVVGFLCFLLFLRAVANYFGNTRLAQSVVSFIIFLIVFFVGAFVGTMAVVATQSFALNGFLLVAIFVCEIVLLIWYLRLLSNTRNTIIVA